MFGTAAKIFGLYMLGSYLAPDFMNSIFKGFKNLLGGIGESVQQVMPKSHYRGPTREEIFERTNGANDIAIKKK